MLEQALRYQLQGEDRVKRVGIGAVVVFLSIFVVPVFTLYGYTVEIMRRVISGDAATPPEWEELDIVETTIDGLKYFGIVFVYGIAVGLITGIPSTILTFVSAALDLGIVGALFWLAGLALQLVGSLLLGVITPLVVVNFAVKDDIAAGFDIDTFRAIGTNRHMLKAIGLGIVLNVLIAIASVVLLVTVVGPPIVAFVGLSAVSVVWAKGYADAYEEVYGERPTVAGGWTAPDGSTAGGATAPGGGPGVTDDVATPDSGAAGADATPDDGRDGTDDESRWD